MDYKRKVDCELKVSREELIAILKQSYNVNIDEKHACIHFANGKELIINWTEDERK